MQNSVKVRVNVSLLRIGNRDWHQEEWTYHRGQILEMPAEAAKKLGNSVGSVMIEPEPELAESESDSKEEASEEEPVEDQPLLPDISEMSSADAIDFIQYQSDKNTLARLKEMEEMGKNRKIVIEAIQTRCDSL